MNKKLSTICLEQDLHESQSEVFRLNRRVHTLQTQIEMLRGALNGLTSGLFTVEDK